MEIAVLNMQGEQVRTVALPEQIFAAPIKMDLMHQAYVRQMANARLGTHKTKTRGEVRGGAVNPGDRKEPDERVRDQSERLNGLVVVRSIPHNLVTTVKKCRKKCGGLHFVLLYL